MICVDKIQIRLQMKTPTIKLRRNLDCQVADCDDLLQSLQAKQANVVLNSVERGVSVSGRPDYAILIELPV